MSSTPYLNSSTKDPDVLSPKLTQTCRGHLNQILPKPRLRTAYHRISHKRARPYRTRTPSPFVGASRLRQQVQDFCVTVRPSQIAATHTSATTSSATKQGRSQTPNIDNYTTSFLLQPLPLTGYTTTSVRKLSANRRVFGDA